MSKTYRGKDRQKMLVLNKKLFTKRVGKKSFFNIREQQDKRETRDKYETY
jgi:hypothetical protein